MFAAVSTRKAVAYRALWIGWHVSNAPTLITAFMMPLCVTTDVAHSLSTIMIVNFDDLFPADVRHTAPVCLRYKLALATAPYKEMVWAAGRA